MVRSPLATRSVSTSKKSSREGSKITRLIIHHTAGGTNEGNVTLLSANNGYDVSAHYVLQTTGRFVAIVPEEYRAWTTGRAADLPSVTVETVNSSGAPSWAVTDAQLESLSQLAADLSKRYGWGRLTRSNVRMHREFMATACPGPYIAGRINQIIARANEIRDGKPATPAAPDYGALKITSWPFAEYTLKKGDTEGGVCKTFGMSCNRFRGLNGKPDGWGKGEWPAGLVVKVALDYAPLTYQYLRIGQSWTDARLVLATAQTQRRLKAAYPSYAGSLVIDGKFGDSTQGVVVEFQDRTDGLGRSGRVDRTTWNKIHAVS